jgi:DNA-binding NarL/FixJ family response regulator
MDTLRIVLADDHVVMREGLKSLVNAQPDMAVVGEADNGRAALEKAKQLRPDVIVMDISMPELNGIQATERLRATCPGVKVLGLTAHEEKGYLRQLLKAGASGCVVKRVAVEELVMALRIVAAGGVYFDPSVAEEVVCGYVGKRSPRGMPQNNCLTEREEEVMRLVAWGYTNKEVANFLNISVRTVETHKVNLMEKLDFKSRTDIVRYALHRGWLQAT